MNHPFTPLKSSAASEGLPRLSPYSQGGGHLPPVIPPRERRAGFALLITITLLAFLVLLLVSLASLTRVETQVASNNQQLAQARQNALMALNIALGQLQRHTGPDQRVTATADLQPLATSAAPTTHPTNDPASNQDLTASGGSASSRITATASVLNNIDAYWRASRNRRWTGAWRNGNATDVATVANTPADANPVAALQAWLVSGNENSTTFLPSTAPSGLTFTTDAVSDSVLGAPDADYPAGRPYRILVGKNTTGASAPADLDRFVTAPQVPIRSTSVPGLGSANTTIGNYAWWIGDEGVKARANLIDPYAAASTDQTNRFRLQSAQRPAVEAMKPTGTAESSDDERGLAPFSDALANNPALAKIITQSQLTALESTPVFQAQLKKRWHDLSVTSRGVLADTRHGGLKLDLSYLLTRPDLASFRTALNAALPASLAPNTAPSATAYNRILSTAATPYATQPPLLLLSGGAFGGNNVYQGMDMFATSATWEQLWSYHNLGNSPTPPPSTPAGVFIDGTTARPRLHTGTQHGLYPLLVQTKLFYKLRMDGSTLDPDGVDRTSNIWVDIIPVVVLANPYPVALEPQDFILRSTAGSTGRVRLYYALTPADPEAADLKISSGTSIQVNTDNGLGSVKLTIKAPRMEAGRAYVFTLEDPLTEIPFDPTSTTATAALQGGLVVNMIPDFNPANVLTFNTARKIAAAPATHAALTTDNGAIAFSLHSANYTTALGDQTLLRSVVPHTYTADSAGNTALVYPFSSGLRHGGGMGFFIHDASNVANSHQTTTYQVNYRTLVVDNAAYTSFTTGNPNGTGQNNIAISFARTRVKNGAASLPGNDTPNDFIQSHLLWRDPSNPTEVRWCIFNTGEGFDGTTVPSSLVGDAGLVNLLYDVPRAEHPTSAVAQLRHFNTAGHIPRVNWSAPHFRDAFATRNHSFQPNLPIGNSYPNPFIVRHKVIDGDGGMGFQYDGSYLFNTALQDRFFFSTFPANGAFDFNSSTDRLINHRHRPFRSPTESSWDDPDNFRSDSRSASRNLLVDGAFNINSTSFEAWKAVLSGLKDVPVGGETSLANRSAPFARTLFQTGGAATSRNGNTENAWTGTINFTPAEVDALAREIVLQVRRRGPFLSMADFTNRRIIAASADASFGVGLGGALQAAIDRIFNQATDVQPASLRQKSNTRSGPTSHPSDDNQRLAEDAFIMPTGISGFSGYVLQSDLLASLGANLSARSDTFTIRTYGDTVNPATGAVLGRAWCEAIVQRTPDYVDTTAPDATPAAGSPAETFGRRYQIVGFRWLSPSDI